MIILVASENAGTGKTTLVTNLAVLFKESENNVLIVDATQNDVARNWRNARNEISSDGEGQVPPPRINYISKYDKLDEKLKQLNKQYDRVIVDCKSGIPSKSDILSEFESAASVAHMVIFPFRPKDFDTLSLIVKHIKKAKKGNPGLVACAVITMYSEADLNETEIDKFFAEHVDTVTLIKPFIYDRDVYQQALNQGSGVIEMDDEEAEAEIRALNSARVKVYKNRNKILPAPTKASETDEEGSTQEQGLETVPSKNGNSVPILNQATRIADKTTKEISEESIEALAREYLDKHNDKMEPLITDVNEALDLSGDSLLTLGDQLAIIFDEIEADDKQSAKKIFVALKKQTAEKVNAFDVNTINKVVKVACNKVISQYRKKSKLPNRWGTLYLLTSLNNEKIHELIASNKITAEITRKDLKGIVDGIKAKKSKTTTIKRLTIKREDGKEVTEKEKNKLVQLLQKNGWVLLEPKTEISAETDVE